MAKYILKDGELYNAKTKHLMKKYIRDWDHQKKFRFWKLRIEGKSCWILATPGHEKEVLEAHKINYEVINNG